MSLLEQIKWIDIPSVTDSRGVLTSIESGGDIPFEIKRIFYMHSVVSDSGGHAHKDTDQVVIATSGNFELVLSDSKQKKTYTMNNPVKGLYIPRLVFVEILNLSKDAVCLVLASTHYDMTKSFRSWEKYLKEIEGHGDAK